MKKIIIFITCIVIAIPSISHSKTFAYILFKDGIIKFDTETDTEVSRTLAPSRLEGFFGSYKYAGCAVDVGSNYLIGLYRYGFYLYELKTLKPIKYVTYPEIIEEPTLAKIIYSQKGDKYYIEINDRSLNKGLSGVVNLAYDKKTFDYLGSMDNLIINMEEKFWFSEDQNMIYVDTLESNMRIYDSLTLQLLRTIDLSSIYEHPTRRDIYDINKGNALLVENNKSLDTDKNNYSFLTYKISDGATTTRVRLTDVESIYNARLIPNSNKVVFNNVSYAPSPLRFPRKGTVSSTVISLYDINSGNKLGLISFDSKYGGEILGIRPQGDKLYYFMFSTDESKMRLAVVDLVNYKIIKEITIPHLLFMVFFEE